MGAGQLEWWRSGWREREEGEPGDAAGKVHSLSSPCTFLLSLRRFPMNGTPPSGIRSLWLPAAVTVSVRANGTHICAGTLIASRVGADCSPLHDRVSQA